MKPVYALALCLGLLEGTDAIAIPGFVSPKVGYSTPLSHDEPKSAPAPASQPFDSTNNPKSYGAWSPKSTLSKLPSVRRSVKTGESSGSDDGDQDDTKDESDDVTKDSSQDTTDFDGTEVAYMEPMMASTYVRTGTLPVDKPEAAPKTESSKKVTKTKSSKSKNDTVKTAKHGSDDNADSSSSGKKKQKGKDKNKGKNDNPGKHTGDDDAPKSSTKTEDSPSSTPTPNSSKGKGKGKGKDKGKDSPGKHTGDDDATKTRPKPEDNSSSASASPKPSGDSSKSKGKGKGKDSPGKHTGDDDATKSSSKKGSNDDSVKSDDSKTKSSKKATKKTKNARFHPRDIPTHQSGTTFDPNSVQGGGKNGPGYYKPFVIPKLNTGYVQTIPPKASERNPGTSFKVKPKPQLNKVSGLLFAPLSYFARENNY